MGRKFNGQPRVVLVVDNPLRDLPGLILVAWKLCQSGVNCFLVPMYYLTREVWGLSPDFVLINYLRMNNQRAVRHVMNAGFPVGVLETEGGVFSVLPPAGVRGNDGLADRDPDTPVAAWEEYALTMASEEKTRSRIARFCAWSEPFAAYASQRGWYRPDQITVTGTPRMDFYAREWREVACGVASVFHARYGDPMVLINGSFPLANPRFQSSFCGTLAECSAKGSGGHGRCGQSSCQDAPKHHVYFPAASVRRR